LFDSSPKKKKKMAAATICTCELTAETKSAIDKFAEGTGTESRGAVILKCLTKTESVAVEDEFDDISVDDLREEIPETSPRFILYRHTITEAGSGHKMTYDVLIHFNPMNTLPSIKRTYEQSKGKVEFYLTSLKNLRSIQVNDVNDFSDSNMAVWIQGLKGTAGARLNTQFEASGRECVSGTG
jgi:Cofilin/tropomyosin-type actin-binding protein